MTSLNDFHMVISVAYSIKFSWKIFSELKLKSNCKDIILRKHVYNAKLIFTIDQISPKFSLGRKLKQLTRYGSQTPFPREEGDKDWSNCGRKDKGREGKEENYIRSKSRNFSGRVLRERFEALQTTKVAAKPQIFFSVLFVIQYRAKQMRGSVAKSGRWWRQSGKKGDEKVREGTIRVFSGTRE